MELEFQYNRQIAQLEKDIKATDVILSARRVGMAVGKAQEEMGAKRFKPSETEKAMTKAGKFNNLPTTQSTDVVPINVGF